jgi:hypothetical protein
MGANLAIAPLHSAAVAWLEAGVHIKAVADLLGHSSIAVSRPLPAPTPGPPGSR